MRQDRERILCRELEGATPTPALAAPRQNDPAPRSAGRSKILHVITGLNTGGAESMLAKLLENQPADPRPAVLSLMNPGAMAPRIRARGVPIHTLGMREGALSASALVRLARAVRAIRPQLVQGWMHHGNLAATLAAALLRPSPAVIWNVRHSLIDIAHEKPGTQAVLRILAALSSRPSAIIYNSAAAARQYAAFGFSASRATLIPNGFDCEQFRPNPLAGPALRQRFGIKEDVAVVGMVARCHPMKDPASLVHAVRLVREAGHDAHLLFVGPGYERAPDDLVRAIRASLPNDRVTLAPERHDLPAWLPGLDVLVLSSAWGEGFPNILGEAMACGVPCVATNVGDSVHIIGDTGHAVQPRDPAGLADAILQLLVLGSDGRRRLGRAARQRVLSLFSLKHIVSEYEALYDRALSGHAAGAT